MVGHRATRLVAVAGIPVEMATNYIISIPHLTLGPLQIFLKTLEIERGRYSALNIGQWLYLSSYCAPLLDANITASSSLLTSGRSQIPG